MSKAAKKAAGQRRPEKGALWQCPICEARGIVDVTINPVLDKRSRIPGTFLCHSCIAGLEQFANDEGRLMNALAYLEQFEKSADRS